MVARPEDLTHLIDDEVRAVACAPDDERLWFLLQERDYNLQYAQDLTRALEKLLAVGSGHIRPPCLRIVAGSGMAKSYILDQFERDHPPGVGKQSKAMVTPVLRIEVPDVPSPSMIVEAILSKLEAPMKKMSVPRLKYFCLGLLKSTFVRLLIFDELNRIDSVSEQLAMAVCETIKWFSSELRVPTVIAGTSKLTRYILADDQLESRFAPYNIPTWKNDEEFMVMVSTIIAHLPLREPPDDDIFTPEGGAVLCKAVSDVSTSKVIELLKLVAGQIIVAGRERITLRDIERAIPTGQNG